MLFTNPSPNDPAFKWRGEATYTYLERSSDSVAVAVRRLVEDWFALFPQNGRDEIAARIRSGDETHFGSAFFELYLNALLHGLGYTVELHPETKSDLPTRPDFLVREEGTDAFYLEARVATETSAAERGTEALRNAVFLAIDQMESPNFFLTVRERGSPRTAPSSSRLTRQLQEWLGTLDPDEAMRQLTSRGMRGLPPLIFRHEDWIVEFSAMPKSHKLRGRPGVRTIGVQFGPGFQPVTTADAVKRALKKKLGKYGKLGLPYIVAVNASGSFGEHSALLEALFGSETFLLDDANEAGGVLTRKQDGLYSIAGNNTRLSAALIVPGLHTTTVASTEPVLFHNPSAALVCEGRICLLSQGRISDGVIQIIPGTLVREILHIDADWLGLPRVAL